MKAHMFSRRVVLSGGARFLLALGLLPLAARKALAAEACADAESGLRVPLHYVEASPDPAKTCSGCSFFKADGADTPACGMCQIFNGPANPKGHCDSWSKKP